VRGLERIEFAILEWSGGATTTAFWSRICS